MGVLFFNVCIVSFVALELCFCRCPVRIAGNGSLENGFAGKGMFQKFAHRTFSVVKISWEKIISSSVIVAKGSLQMDAAIFI